MRISDLLASDVRDAGGTSVGRVREVRVVQDGPVLAGVQAALRVDALLVGRRSLGVRLGYHGAEVKGPWVLRLMFRRLERRIRVVVMTDVERWDDEARIVHLRPSADPVAGQARR